MRPKRVARSGEQPTAALRREGIEYVEIRSLDINMFDPAGINQNTMRFIESFLIYCLLEDSPKLDASAMEEIAHNQAGTAKRGRDPEFRLHRDGRSIELRKWATEILAGIHEVAALLDGHEGERSYRDAVHAMQRAVDNPEATLSARIIAELRDTGGSFFEFALDMARCHRDYFSSIAPLEGRREQVLADEAVASTRRQQEIEAADRISLDEYLQQYFSAC